MEIDALAKAEQVIRDHPEAPTSAALARLLHALRSETSFELAELYRLSTAEFELALEVLAAWRLQRYYRGSAVAAVALPS